MKLIKVETKGFKSFANAISLNFDGGVVGIVGPNGAGKSNINDAIKWVLGEQSIKSLRGDSSDDVIFAGSKLVAASNRAEVSLTFDNSSQRINNPNKKITITRAIKRGGGSNKYYINGEDARLKDIKEVAMESGIGKSSLAIISQGTIADIAEATPEQRRGIFEEAAGISKYKSRKKEALRKLASTTEALEKVSTVTGELERQLGPLRRQANKAKKFLEAKKKLRGVEVSVIFQDIEFYSEKLETLNKELETVMEAKESLNNNINELGNLIDEKTTYKLKMENEILGLTNSFQELNRKLNQIEIDQSRASERRRMIIDGEIAASSADKIQAMKAELEDLSKSVIKYQDWEGKSRADIEQKQTNIAKLQSEIAKINFETEAKKQKLMKVTTKLAMLEDYDKNKTNLFVGVKNIVENKNLFPGYQGLVSELFKVEDQYQKAITTILASTLQHVVVDTSQTAVKAVAFLKNNRGGRATFIPLATIKPKGLIPDHELILDRLPGYVGIASEVVSADPKYRILMKFLLGNVILSQTVQTATSISQTLSNRYMVVSLDGDIVRAGGVISGGESTRSSELIGIKEQINKLKDLVPTLKEDVQSNLKQLTDFSNQISEERAVIAELNIETAKVIEKREVANSQLNILKESYESITNQKFTMESDLLSIDNAENLNQEKASIATLLKAKREAVINLNNELSQYTIQKTQYEKTLREILEESSEKMTAKSQAEFVLSSSRTRLSEEYEMTFDAARKEIKEIADIDEARATIKELRREIKELGNVNLDSIAMFEEVNERYTKLKTSQDELLAAQQKIVAAIDEMDQIIIAKLDQTIKDVNGEFNNVFSNMFGGGYATVKYTDPTNILETGIDVVAQPPGKTVKNLKLFSGGEKSLIAISLLFAILKSKPLPLCILDEVEAALDEANVVRFANYLQQLKDQTQFIVITHRVGTMARVDSLFGATMQNRGVTSFFSVKLEEAKQLID